MSKYFELVQASEREQIARARERGEPIPPPPVQNLEDPFDGRVPWTGTGHSLATVPPPRVRRPEAARASWLRSMAEACFRHPRIFLGIAGASLLITFFTIWITPTQYEATMQLMVVNTGQPAPAGNTSERDANAQAALLRGRDVLSQALYQVGLPPSSAPVHDEAIDRLGRDLQIAPARNSNLLQLSYRDSSPDRAKEMLQAIASSFVSRQLAPLRPSRQPMLSELVTKRQGELAIAQQDVASFQGTTGIASFDNQFAESDPWQQRLATAEKNLQLAVQNRDQAAVDEAVEKELIQNHFVAARPSASSIPVQPRPLLLLVTGLSAAILLAIGVCVLAELKRSTLYTPAELEALTGFATLATVPAQRIEVQK